MPAGSSPEDLHAILSRFQTWTGKGPANGNGHAKGASEEGIREIPYDEAMRQHRNRQAGRSQRRTAAPKNKAATVTAPAAKPAAPLSGATEPLEELPLWVAKLPVIPETEPVIELKVAPPPDLVRERTASVAPPRATRSSAAVADHAAKPSSAKKALAANPPKPEIGERVVLAALPELPARTFVDPPETPLTRRSRPQRRVSPSPLHRSKPPVAAAEASPVPEPAPAAKVSKSSTKTKAPTTPAGVSPAAIAAKTQAKPIPQAALIASPVKASPASPVRRPAIGKPAPTHAAKPKRSPLKRPPFRQVLAGTIQQPKAAVALKNKPAPDRTRRITTRFSPAEERRIEKCAANLGITVSAYLRRCALSALTQKPLAEAPAPLATARTRRLPRRATEQSVQYAAPAQSLFGGWLALLRNRFLGPPIRFAEDA